MYCHGAYCNQQYYGAGYVATYVAGGSCGRCGGARARPRGRRLRHRPSSTPAQDKSGPSIRSAALLSPLAASPRHSPNPRIHVNVDNAQTRQSCSIPTSGTSAPMPSR